MPQASRRQHPHSLCLLGALYWAKLGGQLQGWPVWEEAVNCPVSFSTGSRQLCNQWLWPTVSPKGSHNGVTQAGRRQCGRRHKGEHKRKPVGAFENTLKTAQEEGPEENVAPGHPCWSKGKSGKPGWRKRKPVCTVTSHNFLLAGPRVRCVRGTGSADREG